MPPIRDLDSFVAIHREQRKRLDDYLWIPKSNYQTITRNIASELDPRHSRYLHANNLEARINYARTALWHISNWVGGAEGDSDLHKVTLIPDTFAVELEDAPSFDVKTIEDWAAELFAGINFVAVVEAAYFPTWREGRPTISWHVHGVTKDITSRQLAQRLAPVRRDFRSLVDGIKAAHAAQLPPADVEGWVLYKNKFPLNAYRPYPGKSDVMDIETGVFDKVPTGRWKIRKDLLRPGDIVRMCRVMENRGLDQMIFGGGSGDAVAEAIRSEITAPLRAEEDRNNAEMERRMHHRPPHLATRKPRD